MKFLYAILVLFVSVSASAVQPHIFQDNLNVYIRVPAMPSLTDSQIGEVADLSAKLMQEKVVALIETGDLPLEIDLESFGEISEATDRISDFIGLVDEYNSQNNNDDVKDFKSLIPTAFFVGLGTKFSVSLGVGGGGSITIGLILMPVVEYKIPKTLNIELSDDTELTEKELLEVVGHATETRYRLEWSLVGWPNLDLGVGAGASVGAVRLSGGLLWGPMKKASDFKGFVLGVSGGVNLGVGVNVKTGVVHNSQLGGMLQLKYLIAGAEIGVSAEASAKVNGSYIFNEEGLLQAFFTDKELSGDIDINDILNNIDEDKQRARERRIYNDIY